MFSHVKYQLVSTNNQVRKLLKIEVKHFRGITELWLKITSDDIHLFLNYDILGGGHDCELFLCAINVK